MPWAEWQQHYVCAHGTYMQTHACAHPAVLQPAVHGQALTLTSFTSQRWLGSPPYLHHGSPGKANLFTPTSVFSMQIQQTPKQEPKYRPPPLWLSVACLQTHCSCLLGHGLSTTCLTCLPARAQLWACTTHSSWCFSFLCCLDKASAVSRQQPWDFQHPETAPRAGKRGMVWLPHDRRF